MKPYKQEAVTLDADAKVNKPTQNSHCAWCGDPPDPSGSHGICEHHAEQLLAQASARRRSRS